MKDLLLILCIAGIAWFAWWMFSRKKATPPSASVPPTKEEDNKSRHLRSALQFAQAQHSALSEKKSTQDAWQHRFREVKVAELDQLSGLEFEKFLAGLFRAQGYVAELTPQSADYGADLILSKDGQRIAVQAKRYVGSVGVQAVQEALSGQAYYQCNIAWVITTGAFTNNALELAKKSNVKMIGRNEIGRLMAKYAANIGDGESRQ